MYIFQNTFFSRPFFKAVCHFIWREELRPTIHSLKSVWYLLKDKSEPFILPCWVFLKSSCNHLLFQGFFGTGNFFGNSYLSKIAIFLEDLSWALDFFKGGFIYFPTLIAAIHPSNRVSVFVTERMATIHSFKSRKQPSGGVLRKRCSKNMQQIYRRDPCRSVISIKLHWNHTSAWVFPCKFAAYF